MTATLKPVAAQEPARVGTLRVKMAVIDMNAVRRNAAAVKDIRIQVEKFRAAFQAEIKKEEEELRTANQELGRQRAILSPEAFTEERRKFDQRLAGVQRKVQQRKQNLDKALNDAMFEVQKSLNKIVVELAKEHSLTLVLRKEQTVLVAKPLNITEVVLQRLDSAMPTIKVPEPGK
ncbi:MAG: OmpH family outer membrane protein [Rhodospirillales bacterium]|nr:OmpH family outer membrane protein [Rhodospirillales bacterium]